LYLVPLQFDLFDHRPLIDPEAPSDNEGMTDASRDSRSANQWLRSIVAYLEFRTGDRWRRLSDPRDRWDQTRVDYVDAIRLINGLRGFPEFIPAKPLNQELYPKRLLAPRQPKTGRVA
jgi:hypothetical protein